MKIIREMMPQDNEAMAKIIVTVLAEHGFKDERTGGYDINNLPPKIKELFSYIYRQGGKFFVVEETDTRTVLGGGGFLPRITSSLCSNHYGFFRGIIAEKCVNWKNSIFYQKYEAQVWRRN